ncbi:hypothetical protein KIN20_036132 [Parelaphostrongylus tenuis]|uniref:Uncharacterized protein n=1 Tax=Parelaphostrongylus tenuis TaxID=148309 RepID=A0AAD5RC49_PARTN|nr:hypothetical protein KIN20_036132 [Parelaphostrongylus tenuis]
MVFTVLCWSYSVIGETTCDISHNISGSKVQSQWNRLCDSKFHLQKGVETGRNEEGMNIGIDANNRHQRQAIVNRVNYFPSDSAQEFRLLCECRRLLVKTIRLAILSTPG